MDTGLIVSFVSLFITLVATLIAVKGPKKYRKLLIEFLWLSIGLTLGLFMMYSINQLNSKPASEEFLPPTDLVEKAPIKISNGITAEYEEWIPDIYFLKFTTAKETKDIQLRGEGDVAQFRINNHTYDVKLILDNPGGNVINITINKYM